MFGAKFKSRLTFAILLSLLITVSVLAEKDDFLHHREKRTVPLSTTTKRLQLLEDSLGWMTFRNNGRLMTKEELAPLFLDNLKTYYLTSRFFRTFVIAFEHGVLPKLTLNENEACDPNYTLEYKSAFNSSVTWYYQKEFTFKKYKERESNDDKYCDYRQGLICKPATQKCECPEGSKMQPISQGNPVKRCLLEENEICALIDIDHGDDPKHKFLADNLYQMIFNLEKPVSCKQGTQCRFKSTDITFSRCYNVHGGPWAPPYMDKFGNRMPTWTVGFGEECVLGLHATPGSCHLLTWPDRNRIGLGNGYTCYNFGPPRSQLSSGGVTENRTGFCAHEYGPYGISDGYGSPFLPLFSPFVNPRTVPLRGSELGDFFRKCLNIYSDIGSGGRKNVRHENGPCSISSTEKLEKAWKYFSSLENDPPPGKDFVPHATKTELYANLQSVIDVTKDANKTVCQVFAAFNEFADTAESEYEGVLIWIDYDWDGDLSGYWRPSLRCVPKVPPSTEENEGICKKPGKLDTKKADERVRKFIKDLKLAETGLEDQEEDYDRGIFEEYEDDACLTRLEPVTASRILGVILKGGYCENGFVCYKDYSDDGNKYNKNCELLAYANLGYACHESGDEVQYSKCEAQWQDKLLSQELENLPYLYHTTLNKGKRCAYSIESSIRKWIVGEPIKTNKYKILSWLDKTKMSGGSVGGLCDRTKLLECKDTGTCECLENTQPRTVTVDGVVYYSDYCYLATGSCNTDPTTLKIQNYSSHGLLDNPSRLTEWEKNKILEFYGKPEANSNCEGKNLCLYLDTGRQKCTTKNTGKTGYDLKPDPTPKPKPTPVNNKHPGWHTGRSCTLCINERLTGSLLIGILIYTGELIPFSHR